MKRSHVLFTACILISTFTKFSNASGPSPLQDFCVAVNDSKAAVFVNGRICKDPKIVVADDFFFSGLNKPGNSGPVVPGGSRATPVSVDKLSGLNTLGITLVRIDYAPHSVNPPYTNQRASKILLVMEGTLSVGFVASDPMDPINYKLFTKTLYPGDVYVFPKGVIQFQYNTGITNAVAFSFLSSQNPGVTFIANAVFGSEPPINPEVLTKAFQVDKKVIDYLQAQFKATKYLA